MDGVTTNYTLDLNTGLTQVLSDGTNSYTYGLGRISQTNNSTAEYFLGDALGSVRQMTNQSGTVTFAQSYDPYGVIAATNGTSRTDYGFTGESQGTSEGDSTQLVYLRARWYNPADGRFQSRDTWGGSYNNPITLNRWAYANANPLRYTDLTGRYGSDVHTDRTKIIAMIAGRVHCQDLACIYVDSIANLIAQGDQVVDDSNFTSPVKGSAPLHFIDMPGAASHAQAAIDLEEPYLLGAALHQVQDWYSHWNEGYRATGPFGPGHRADSLKAGSGSRPPDFLYHRPPEMVVDFYKQWPDTVSILLDYYSPTDLQNVSIDKMIDLFIYTFGSLTMPLRATYGYDPDHYFGFTEKDRLMEKDTDKWITAFFENINPTVACDPYKYLNYSQPSQLAIRDFLTTGEYAP